jgi:hypothetical protein
MGTVRFGTLGSLTVACCLMMSSAPSGLTPEILHSVNAIPVEIAGRFRDPRGFQQSDVGQYFVFDRRGHTVYGVDEKTTGSWRIAEIGAEPGRILRPSAFSVAGDGTFVVADAPGGRERVQVFNLAGFRIAGFRLPARDRPRVTFGDIVVNGVGSRQYTGTSVLISQPETGSLVVEYSTSGRPIRTFGALRATGHEDDPELHQALNSGIPLVDPSGGFYFVFQAGIPAFRKYNDDGELVLERLVQGREIDPVLARLPTEWRRENDEIPLIEPTIRTAAVDRHGQLWLAFMVPYTYVFDRDGDKTRTVQFRAAGIVSPTSLFFGPRGRLLVTPGLYEFDVGAAAGERP